MHVGIAGPIASTDIARLLDPTAAPLPLGYPGAPLLATLIEELIARGHRVTAFTLSSDMPLVGDASMVAKGPHLAVHFVPMRPRAWPFNGHRVGRIVDLYAFERRGLERAMRAAAPDVMHAHWAYEFAWAALRSGIPHVVTCHDAPLVIARMSRGPRHAGYRWLRALMARHVLRRAGRVTAVSPYMQAQIRRWCVVPVAVVPNPIDRRAFAIRHKRSPGRARICMVCNGWGERKNPEPALLAFDRLSRSHPSAELVMCGRDFGPGERAEQWWRGQGLAGKVEFRGAVCHDDVLALMGECDVLLHPALEESFGVVVAEAMAVGLPIVAGAQSGAVPWVVGPWGRLVDVRRPQAMAAALSEVLFATPASAEAVEAARTSILQRFSASAVAIAYEAQYASALTLARSDASRLGANQSNRDDAGPEVPRCLRR